MDANGTGISVEFEPWESAFFVFSPGEVPLHPERDALVPGPVPITGTWRMKLAGHGFETYETKMDTLASWTASPRTRASGSSAAR